MVTKNAVFMRLVAFCKRLYISQIKRGADAMPGILVVEDDENLNRGITFSLKKSGYEVFSAESVKKVIIMWMLSFVM